MNLWHLQFVTNMYENAYYEYADIKKQRGYVSRKPKSDYGREVHKAHGKREGEYYILVPSYCSTRYCYRQYLKKVKKG